jgi:glycosyltransferase involved in cell wall biosynthesis
VPLLDGYRWIALENSARAPSLDGFLASRTPGVRRAFERDRPDAVVVSGWQSLPFLQALRACESLGIPCLVRGESSGLRRRPWWTRAIHRRLLARFAACLAIGRANLRFYRDNGVPPERLFLAPYFIDEGRFRNAADRLAPEREEIRREWGLSSGDVCFLFAGKLIAKKRIADLISASAIAGRSRSSARVLVVGDGEQATSARELAERLRAPVAFAGFLNQTEISRAYVAADCLVLPSDYGETWGLVVNEAMVHGLPAIVSDRVGCGPDLVEDGVTGRVFPFGDVDALARAIVEIAGDGGARREMGAHARRRVAAYSADSAVRGTLDAVRYATAASARAVA